MSFRPAIKNIPVVLRRLWSQCLAQALAQAVYLNNETGWTELLMLPKSTLCRLAWIRGRLRRWLAGERASLWEGLPSYNSPKSRQHSEGKKQRQNRCIALTAEGGFSNACRALTSSPPLDQSQDVAEQLRQKHPSAVNSVDLSRFGNASSTLVPLSDATVVEQCIISFHRLSDGGPSRLRPIHLKMALTLNTGMKFWTDALLLLTF